MNKNIDWIALRWGFFAFSGVMVAAGLAGLLLKGFNYGIDFTGGTVVQVAYEQPRVLADVRKDLEKAGYPEAQPQSFAGGKSFAIYLQSEQNDAAFVDTFVAKLKTASSSPFIIERKEFVGPSVGHQLKRQALTAITLALFAIIIYIAFRFDNPLWGASAVATIAHDIIIISGVFAWMRIEVDLVIVAAFLTIAGYSINDTIVIFDRMRERLRLFRGEDLRANINNSINEMRSRTLITNGLVLAVVASLFVLGGPVIHNFAFCMLLGSIVGTYSTIGISTQLLYTWAADEGRRSGGASSGAVKVKEGGRRK